MANRFLVASILMTGVASADVKLPAIFSEHMVLQKAKSVPIWGKADPGEEVTVSIDGKSGKIKAGQDGRWMVRLDLEKSGQGPFEMTVEGRNKIVIQDIVVGEVWLASGQSNMEFRLGRSRDAAKEAAQANFSLIRQFQVSPYAGSPVLQEDCKGAWVVCSPQTAESFTAVGYYFAKRLFKELNTPIGLVHNAWGGSPVEAWISSESLEKDPELKEARDRVWKQKADYAVAKETYVTEMEKWLKSTGREDKATASLESYIGESINAADWKEIKMPSTVFEGALPQGGAVWLRGEVNIPAQLVKGTVAVRLGDIQAFPTVYVNGSKVGEYTYKNYSGTGFQYNFYLRAGSWKEGKNTLAVRLYAPFGNTKKINLNVDFVGITGAVLSRIEYALPVLDAAATASLPKQLANAWQDRDVATYLFNGMNGPILPYGIRGAIWYQGEANAGRSVQYRKSFPLVIEDWRKHWKQPDMPFYFCQLANYQDKVSEPKESGWAELREAQTMTLKLPHTGQAVIIDVGEAKDIHPLNKETVGERLALPALAKTYGRKIPYSSPMYESMKVNGSKIEIKFSHADGGLVAKELPATYDVVTASNKKETLVKNSPQSQLEGFAICGEDKNWVWANAKIEGEKVIVWADSVAKPVAVRYAWANNPTCNLYNGAGLPACPFRTDTFTEITAGKKY